MLLFKSNLTVPQIITTKLTLADIKYIPLQTRTKTNIKIKEPNILIYNVFTISELQVALESCSVKCSQGFVSPFTLSLLPMQGGMIQKLTVLIPKSMVQTGQRGWGNPFFFLT